MHTYPLHSLGQVTTRHDHTYILARITPTKAQHTLSYAVIMYLWLKCQIDAAMTDCSRRSVIRLNKPCTLKNLCAGCSDIQDVISPDPESWHNGSELTLMLYHPGFKIRQPIAPISLLTLDNSHSHLANPWPQRHEQIRKGSQTPAGLSGGPEPSMSQQISAPSTTQLEEPALNESPQGKMTEPVSSRPNPSPGQEPCGIGEAETLTVLVWVHPAAAKEAWETLREIAQGLGTSCTSRSA